MEPLSPADLDPRIADALCDRIDRVLTPGAIDPVWLRAGDVARSLPPFQSPWIDAVKIGFTPPLVIFAPFMAGVAAYSLGLPTLAVAASALVGLGGSVALGVGLGPRLRRARARAHQHYFRPELVDALIPTLAPTPVEEAYLRGLVALMEAQEVLGAALSRELATALNATLDADRRRSSGAVDALRAAETTLRGLQAPPTTDAARDLRRHTMAVEAAVAELRAVTGSGSGR